jgi:hypothetical protein
VEAMDGELQRGAAMTLETDREMGRDRRWSNDGGEVRGGRCKEVEQKKKERKRGRIRGVNQRNE